MQLIQQAGMNVIRIAESTWSTSEPSEGVFDFSHITRVIEAAAAHNLQVIIGTPTYAIPAWLYKLAPDILMGRGYGPRQQMDITHPVYLQHAETIIRRLVQATAPYANVIGYQIDNETKHYNFNSPRALEDFRAWLQRKFSSVDELNKAFGLSYWSNSVSSFDDLPDPESSINGSYACAFEAYRRSVAAAFLHWQARIVTEEKQEHQFITQNFDFDWHTIGEPGQQDGYSRGLQPGISWYEASSALTLIGTDIYCPVCDEFTGMEIAFGGDCMRPLHQDNYLVLESQSQAFTGFLPYPGQLRLMALEHLASGARGLLYWPWMSLHNGLESYWKGILSHDCEPGPTYDEIKEIGQLFQRLSPALMGLKKSNKIAIIVSVEALHALRYFPTAKDVSYNDILLMIYKALFEMNLEVDILYDRDPTPWSRYRMLIFPQLYCANEATIERVRSYVSGGGTALATFRSFFADENLKIYHDRQPHGLTQVFGMHYSRFTRDKESPWMELLEPDRAAVAGRYGHKVWSGIPAATRSRFGKGHAWYLGTIPTEESLKEFLRSVCDAARISMSTITYPVICRRGTTPDGSKLCFLLNASQDTHSIRLPIGGKDLITGTPCTMGMEVILSAWDAVIVREQL